MTDTGIKFDITPFPNYGREMVGEMDYDELQASTQALLARMKPADPDCDPISVPIYNSAVYRITSLKQFTEIFSKGKFIYQRCRNPTTASAEVVVNEMEGGKGALVFASGLTAMFSVLYCFLKTGDHIIVQFPIYCEVLLFVRETLSKFGVEHTFVQSGSSIDDIEKLIKSNTRMIIVESPCNVDLSIADFTEIGKLKKLHPNILTVVDSTFGTPCLQQPIKLGFDFSVQSCTKYMGGHNDIIAGSVTCGDLEHWKSLKNYATGTGVPLHPYDSYLLIRGLKTLSLRMERISDSAQMIAEFLEKHPKVKSVVYPGLKSHPQHEIAKKQMKRFGGMMYFDVEHAHIVNALCEKVKVIVYAPSLGGCESFMIPGATMVFPIPIVTAEEQKRANMHEGLVRLNVGIEDPKDLIRDLAQALDQV